ncbi:MAG: TRAP transporter substrate-binding protein DctP [Desulfatibacillaceae bacterium]
MRMLTSFIAMSMLILLILTASAGASEPTIVWRVATLAPKNLGWAKQVENIVLPWISEASDDNVAMKIYWGGAMGNDDDYIRKMRIGQLQAAGLTGVGANLAAEEFAVIGLPFLFRGFNEVDHIRSTMFPVFDKYFEENGYKLILWIDQDFDQIYSSKWRFDDLDDFVRAKIVTWYGPSEKAMLEALGADPIELSVNDTPEAVRQGVADTNIAPAIWQVGAQLYSMTRYVNTMKLRYSPAVILATLEAWNEVPEEYRRRLEVRREEVQQEFCVGTRRDNQMCIEGMLQFGVEMVDVPEKELSRIRKTALGVYDDLAGELYSRDLLNQVRAHLAEFRSGKASRHNPKARQPVVAVASRSSKTGSPEKEAPARAENVRGTSGGRTEPEGRTEVKTSEEKRVHITYKPQPSTWELRKLQLEKVQTRLKRLGYYDFQVDGVMGPITRTGIVNYQRDNGLTVTGNVNDQLLGHMGIE